MNATMTVEALSLEVLHAAHDAARAHARATAEARPAAGDSTPHGARKKASAELAYVLACDAEKQAEHALAVALDRELTGPVGDCIESLEAAEARATAIRNELQRIDVAAVATLRALADRLGVVARARQEQGLPGPRVRLAPGPWTAARESLKTPPAPPGPDGRIGALRYAEREAALAIARMEAARVARERERGEVEALHKWNADTRNQEAMERAGASLATSRTERAAEDDLIRTYVGGLQ
jgi:hypothetical protein